MFQNIRRAAASLIVLAASIAVSTPSAHASFASRSIHGIFVINADHLQTVRGISQYQIDSSMLTNPLVDGISLRLFWSDAEPTEGTFVWTRLDSLIAQAAAAHKVVTIKVMPGWATPSWVYSAGAQPFNFIWDQSTWGPALCATASIPVPWDPVFLSKWSALVQAFGAHYSGNPTVVGVKITGLNSYSEETNLPGRVNEQIVGGVSCTGNNDVTNWQTLGYTRTLAVNAWMTIAQMFAQAFPNLPLVAAMQPGGFPTIDQNGQLIKGYNGFDTVASSNIISNAVTAFGPEFILQNDALSNTWIWNVLANYASQIDTGYQTLSALGSGLPTAMTNAINAGGDYFELYEGDITNSTLQSALSSVHTTFLALGQG